ncbi:TetR family transcriptional regulator [Longimycelium tulufanense]|uniref:TetR family transcriptional regulator n=1 Tax=Longimycelium tulufanense TaxID=907463 RepID=A0A8J3CH64_9PSEU|nr:WHG domain-containing protein [Longimycelium tulufanense]GGM66876.1 TetR family transcriptional regulator [Longimycelium tulufanense]
MSEATRRERLRAETEREIRASARELLVREGREAVTLRAIARELGITAPALYRYYDSREALLVALCQDICADLAADLRAAIDRVGQDQPAERVFAACWGFRRWALAHPHEFALVFARPSAGEPAPTGHELGRDEFGRAFLEVVLPLFVSARIWVPADDTVPTELHDDLLRFREMLAETLGGSSPARELSIGAIFLMLQSWARLYGHVALEVFGQLDFAVSSSEPLFESMLAGLAEEVGLTPSMH